MYGETEQDIKSIREVSAMKALEKQKGPWLGGGPTEPVYDATYRDWAMLEVMADIALSLRILAAPIPAEVEETHRRKNKAART